MGKPRPGCRATCPTAAFPGAAGRAAGAAPVPTRVPGQASGHPPFASQGSGCWTAARQLSGPPGAAGGSSLLHCPRYSEQTPLQDPHTCGHCTRLLKETHEPSARGCEQRRHASMTRHSVCLWKGGHSQLNTSVYDSKEKQTDMGPSGFNPQEEIWSALCRPVRPLTPSSAQAGGDQGTNTHVQMQLPELTRALSGKRP